MMTYTLCCFVLRPKRRLVDELWWVEVPLLSPSCRTAKLLAINILTSIAILFFFFYSTHLRCVLKTFPTQVSLFRLPCNAHSSICMRKLKRGSFRLIANITADIQICVDVVLRIGHLPSGWMHFSSQTISIGMRRSKIVFGHFSSSSSSLMSLGVTLRSQYFKIIEECVSQIVLHRSGTDPDFSYRKRLDVDFSHLIGKSLS